MDKNFHKFAKRVVAQTIDYIFNTTYGENITRS